MKRFIEVYLALPLFEIFTYEVPDHLVSEIEIGKRVLVPVGSRKITGYIKNIIEKPENQDFEIKKIYTILDSIPVLTENLIKFFNWISEYYIYPTGLTIKSALPSGINPDITTNIKITEKGIENLDSSEILGFFKNQEINEKQLEKLNIKKSQVNLLVNKGFLKKEIIVPDPKTKQKREKFLKRIKTDTIVKLTEKQMDILERIPFDDEIPKADISSKVKGALPVIKALVKKELVEETEKRVFRDPLGEAVSPDVPPVLNEEQEVAVKQVVPHVGKDFKRFLLYGVTGSGKTEVYLRLVQSALDLGKTAIVLVPEISLISQTERRFKARFGELTAVIHSGLSSGEKLDQWTQISSGQKRVVIGARSAIFAPADDVGIIIVDEEHEQSYKQDSPPRYNARDMAVVRSNLENCPVVLGSATPSVETWRNTETGKFEKLTLLKRANNSNLPEVSVYDLKKSKKDKGVYKFISYFLASEIHKTLEKKEQVLLFLNRRGFSSFILCNLCGESIKCKYCSVSMTYHKFDESLVCHVCGEKMPVPKTCPKCFNPDIVHLGTGTEKLEKACNFLFPEAVTIRLDQDTTSKKGFLIKKLKQIRKGEADIIIGTQMIAKGHDFPGITLVGIINADNGFNFPDFRAGERSFQLLSQVSGRAGRGQKKGKVIMQTYNPDHFSIQTAKTQNFVNFYNKEIGFRKSLSYPPFSKTALVKISGTEKNRTKDLAQKCRNEISRLKTTDSNFRDVMILGPAEAPLFIAASRFRYQILLKSGSSRRLIELIKQMKRKFSSLSKGLRISIDIDPYSMM